MKLLLGNCFRTGTTLVCVAVLLGCVPGDDDEFLQLQLPKSLREISGLTSTLDHRLLAISDERGRVFEIDYSETKVVRHADFGVPPITADFEGLAATGDQLYAVTSNGRLYQRTFAEKDSSVYTKTTTGAGEICEIEGLAAHPEEPLLYMLCKTARVKRLKKHLTLLAWSVQQQILLPSKNVLIDLRPLDLKGDQLHPSGVTFVANNEVLIVAAQERRWVKARLDGEIVQAGKLPDRKYHKQTEGIASLNGFIYLADEGAKRGLLTRYKGGLVSEHE